MSTDLFLTHRSFDEMTSDRIGVDFRIERGDIKLVGSRANLAQAIVNRLLTRVGELENLGHPEYGSRLFQLIGEPNSNRARALAELYIREALANEPRVQEILSISFAPPSPRPEKRGVLEASISVLAVDDDQPLTITLAV